MMGEDGRIAGNPDCDIQLNNASIDLAGLPLLNPTTITIVRGTCIDCAADHTTGSRPPLRTDRAQWGGQVHVSQVPGVV